MDLPLMEFEYENDCAMSQAFTLSSFNICLNRITFHCDDNAINFDPITIMTSSGPVSSIFRHFNVHSFEILSEKCYLKHPSDLIQVMERRRAVWRCFPSGEYEEE